MRYDPDAAARLAFMTLHFPDEVATNVLTIDADRSQVRHGGVQGDGDPRGGGLGAGSAPARGRADGRRARGETFPGIAVLMWGAMDERSNIHSVNESVDLGELEHMALAEALFIRKLAEHA